MNMIEKDVRTRVAGVDSDRKDDSRTTEDEAETGEAARADDATEDKGGETRREHN